MAVLTIYNCGTAFDESSNDIIAGLAKRTGGRRGVDWIINAGAGSDQMSETIIGTGLGRQIDQLFGRGMYPAAADSVRTIAQVRPSVVNFCGWSRGAITSILTANVMALRWPTIRCNMFLFDPVLGDPIINPATHQVAMPMLDHVGANVDNLWVLQQMDATDFIFQAHAPFSAGVNRAHTTRLLPMPGVHGSAVYIDEDRYQPLVRIALGLAVTNLLAWGTSLPNFHPSDPRSWFDDYARLWLNLAGPAGYRPSDGIVSNRSRAIGSDNLVLRCFFNQHHIDLANRYVPKITLALLYTLTSRQRPPANLIADAEAELATATTPQTTHEYLRKSMTWLRMYN